MRSTPSRRRLSSTSWRRYAGWPSGVQPPRSLPGQPGLGRDDHVVGVRVQRLAQQVLGHVGTVGVGGVEEGDPDLDGPAQHADRLVVVPRRSPDALAGQLHRAVAEAYDGQVTAELSKVPDGAARLSSVEVVIPRATSADVLPIPLPQRQNTFSGRNCTEIRGPAWATLGTACSQVRWQEPPITTRSPWPIWTTTVSAPPRRGRRVSRGGRRARRSRPSCRWSCPADGVAVPRDAVATVAVVAAAGGAEGSPSSCGVVRGECRHGRR